jgi:NADPH:quinone reductase-like Zn-dependent oxidoreductase
MKAAVLHEYGPPQNLKYEDFENPKPKGGEVLVRVHAIGVNPIDWKIRSGAMKGLFPVAFPAILGYDVAGVVSEVGEGVNDFAVGDRIFARTGGAYAELAVVKAQELARVPEKLDLTVAAALPVVATTADQLIREQAQVKAGQTILLTGALGSVGRLALFSALEQGAHVIAGVRKKHMDEAMSLGAIKAIDISDDSSIETLGLLDAVTDTIGGALASKLLTHVKPGGIYASVVGPPHDAALHPQIQIRAFGSHADTRAMTHYAEAIRDGKVALRIDAVLPLAEAAKAHEMGEKGGIGKIMLRTP